MKKKTHLFLVSSFLLLLLRVSVAASEHLPLSSHGDLTVVTDAEATYIKAESESEPDISDNDGSSTDSLPPEIHRPKRTKPGRQVNLNETGVRPPKQKGNGLGSSIGDLTHAIANFGEVYEQVESAKLQQVVEMEKQRMKFAKELELQRMQFFMKTQLELQRMQFAKELE